MDDTPTRRRFVAAGIGTVVALGLAGCTEAGADKDDEEDEPEVEVSGSAGVSAE